MRQRYYLPYNTLWACAFEYALNSKMSIHRAEQFAKDYATFFEDFNEDFIGTPAEFVDFREDQGHIYHHDREEAAA